MSCVRSSRRISGTVDECNSAKADSVSRGTKRNPRHSVGGISKRHILIDPYVLRTHAETTLCQHFVSYSGSGSILVASEFVASKTLLPRGILLGSDSYKSYAGS